MSQPVIEIDPRSGFCFGVVTAINKAEEELAGNDELYCLGDIVHNSAEVERLRQKGLKTIEHSDLQRLKNAKVLLRAHGEPPMTYATASERGIQLIDATCPVVLRLQQRIKAAYTASQMPGARKLQTVIYGRNGHAEVNGLVGQTNGTAIVVEDTTQLDRLDYGTDIALYSQTTKPLEGFRNIIAEIKRRLKDGARFEYSDTICRQVANRVEHLRQFAATHDVVLFVAGEKSSNGKVLFEHCKEINPRSYMTSGPEAPLADWFTDAKTIGICGATSTPRWLMEEVAARVGKLCGE